MHEHFLTSFGQEYRLTIDFLKNTWLVCLLHINSASAVYSYEFSDFLFQRLLDRLIIVGANNTHVKIDVEHTQVSQFTFASTF